MIIEAVAQSDHCIVLIDQYVANGGSHVFEVLVLRQRASAKAEPESAQAVLLVVFVQWIPSRRSLVIGKAMNANSVDVGKALGYGRKNLQVSCQFRLASPSRGAAASDSLQTPQSRRVE